MALRSLVTKLRSPAAAALRLPPPAGARPRFFFSFAKTGQHGRGINLELASEAEIRRHADLVGKEIDETLERLSVKRDKADSYWRDLVGSAKLWVGSCAAIELVLRVDSRRRGPEN